MSDIVKVFTYSVDLDAPIVKTPLASLFATDDDQAHRFELSLHKSGKAVDLAGAAVTAYFIRSADRVTVPLTGSTEDGKAVVTLTDACYALAGMFALIIKVAINDVRTTVFYGEGGMTRSRTDSIIDENNVVPSLDELLAQIQVIDAAVTDARTAAAAADTAARDANNAAANANQASAQIDGLTVSASASDTAGATVSEKDGVKHIAFALPQGPIGPAGQKGADGTMTFSDLTAEQRESLRGPAGSDGKDGKDGYTPVKGTDYWTASDRAEMVNDVLAALPNASGVGF